MEKIILPWTLFFMIISITLSEAQEPNAVRLRNQKGMMQQGRVEVYVKLSNSYVWARLCDSRWDQNVADIVCRQLGFVGVESVSKDSFLGEGNQRDTVKMDQCTEGADSLTSAGCRLKDGGRMCRSKNDAGVRCLLPTTTFTPPRDAVRGGDMTGAAVPGQSGTPDAPLSTVNASILATNVSTTTTTSISTVNGSTPEGTSSGVISDVLPDRPRVGERLVEVGLPIGGVLFFVIVACIILVVCLLKRRKSKKKQARQLEPVEYQYSAGPLPQVTTAGPNASAPPLENEYQYSAISESLKAPAPGECTSQVPSPSSDYQYKGFDAAGTGSHPSAPPLADVCTDEDLYTVPDAVTTENSYQSLKVKSNTFAGLQKMNRRAPKAQVHNQQHQRLSEPIPGEKPNTKGHIRPPVKAPKPLAFIKQKPTETSTTPGDETYDLVGSRDSQTDTVDTPITEETYANVDARGLPLTDVVEIEINDEAYDVIGERNTATNRLNPVTTNETYDLVGAREPSTRGARGSSPSMSYNDSATNKDIIRDKKSGLHSLPDKKAKPMRNPKVALKPTRPSPGSKVSKEAITVGDDENYDLVGFRDSVEGSPRPASHSRESDIDNSIYANDIGSERASLDISPTVPEEGDIVGVYAVPRALGIVGVEDENHYQNSDAALRSPSFPGGEILYHNISRKPTLPV